MVTVTKSEVRRVEVEGLKWRSCRGFLSMIQVITNAQWANHIGRPIILQYPALASWPAVKGLNPRFSSYSADLGGEAEPETDRHGL